MADQGTEKKTGLSFSFAKRVPNIKLNDAVLKDKVVPKKETDFVTSLEGKEVKSAKPKAEKAGELVIPLIKNNNWREHNLKVGSNVKPLDTVDSSAKDDTDSAAVREILQDAARRQENWEERGTVDSNMAIPLLLKNKVPSGFETDEKLDVALRPDEAKEADYEQVPIEQYGFAMLRGMGWKEGMGIGKGHESFTPIQAVARPKGMGLGADRSKVVQDQNEKRGGRHAKDSQAEEELVIKKGASCLIEKGRHEDLYGKIEGVDEDNARVVIKLTLSGQSVTLSQHAIKLVSDKEYDKYSKYLNKTKVDKYKDDQTKREKREKDSKSDGGHSEKDKHRTSSKDRESRREREHSSRDKDKESSSRGRSGDTDSPRERDRERSPRERDSQRDRARDKDSGSGRDRQRDSKRERSREKDADRESDKRREKERREKDKYRDEESEDGKVSGKKRKNLDEESLGDSKKHKESKGDTSSSSSTNGAKADGFWLRTQLRVRFIDREYKKGKYYNVKMEIIDVLSRESCICRTPEGKVLEDIPQRMLETLIPKSEPGYVMIVLGKLKGQVAEILKKNKEKCIATVQLLRNKDDVLKMDFDSVCEFLGDISQFEF